MIRDVTLIYVRGGIMRLSQPKASVSERAQRRPLARPTLLSWTRSRPLRLALCLVMTYLAEPLINSLIETIVGERPASVSALKTAEAKKRKKKRRKKKRATRSKSLTKRSKRRKKKKSKATRRLRIGAQKSGRSRRRAKKRRAGQGRRATPSRARTGRRTGVRSLKRRDQRGASNVELERGARDRWRRSKNRVRGQARRRGYRRLRHPWRGPYYGRRARRSRQVYVGVHVHHHQGPPYEIECDEQSAQDMCSPDRPPQHEVEIEESFIKEPESDEVFVDLEMAGGLWMYHIPKTSSGDWDGVTHIADYHIPATPSYRALVNLSTRHGDLSVSYQAREGVDFLGSGGSLFDIMVAVPWLERWSLGYKRVRFEEGSVTLKNRGMPIEQQAFSFEASEMRLSYQALDLGGAGLQVWGRLHERGLPRQLYLAYQADSEDAITYYDISDQLLWVDASAIDIGFEIGGGSEGEAGWMWNFGMGLGGGTYELRTPLGGAGLDRGSLLSIPLYGTLSYRLPLSASTGLKFNYHCAALFLEPLGLPDQLEDELSEEEDISGLSISFGSIDISQHLWLSVYVEL